MSEKRELCSALNNRGVAYQALGKSALALADFNASLEIDQNDVQNHIRMSRFLSSCRDPMFRDGRRAVSFATRACMLTGWKEDRPLAALAAAYAECGQFDKAVIFQKEAGLHTTAFCERIESIARLICYINRIHHYSYIDDSISSHLRIFLVGRRERFREMPTMIATFDLLQFRLDLRWVVSGRILVSVCINS